MTDLGNKKKIGCDTFPPPPPPPHSQPPHSFLSPRFSVVTR